MKHQPIIIGRVLGYRAVHVLEFVRITIERQGRAPSYGMIADELGFLSRADVCNVVKRLEKRGLLMRAGPARVRSGSGWNQPVLRLPS